jgi:hypothetical protein
MYKVNLIIKRCFDFVSCLVAVIVLTPVWIIVAIAIKLDSKGPVFFKQGRRTKDGRIFQMLKFRSMVVDAEKQGTGLFSYDNDPRVTKVGAFLRKTSIDEFPQFFNVLKGDISVVGPRPCVTYELGDFDTLNKKASYDIFAVFAVPVDESDKNTFKFYEFVNAYDAEHYSTFISKCKALSFYETGISAKQGDKLLTLATCEYTNNNGRLVVVAKRTTR